MLLSFYDYEVQARKLAKALDVSFEQVQHHRFPDDEVKLTLPVKFPRHVILYRSLDHPNEKLIEILLAARTIRSAGVDELTLIAPYLCYMRQDKVFHVGETISQGIIGQFLADLFDNVITVDPHLHRISTLAQAVPARNAIALTATDLMADFIHERLQDPVIIGPDRESEQWVSAIAGKFNWQYTVCSKTRTGDREVDVSLPDTDLNGKSVVLVDDVASSGQTICQAARQCLKSGAEHVDVLVTHALFVDDALTHIKESGVRYIWSTDSIRHPSNVISLTDLLKTAFADMKTGNQEQVK